MAKKNVRNMKVMDRMVVNMRRFRRNLRMPKQFKYRKGRTNEKEIL